MKAGKIVFVLLILLLCWAVVCPAKSALRDESVISEVSVSRESGNFVIQIGLNFPMRYVSHIPVAEGDEVLIRILPVSTAAAVECVQFNKESKAVSFMNIRVQYIGSNVGGPYVNVSFPHSSRFTVRQGKDYRSLAVVLQADISWQEPDGIYDLAYDEAQQIMLSAQEGESAGELPRAIQLYTKLTERADDPDIREEAQERLADARFTNKQFAHAKAEYQRYLELYPDGKNREEVERKLNILLEGREDDGLSVPATGEVWAKEVYGEVSQFLELEGYRYQGDDFEHDVSLVVNDLNIRYAVENSRYEFRGAVDGGYEVSLNNSSEDRGRLSSFYFEGEQKNSGLWGRVGRSYGNRAGVYGRFDGAELSIPFGAQYAMSFISGFPVDSSYDDLETDTIFYGGSLDCAFFNDNWEVNTFFIHQEADGLTDRQAIGTENRFSGQNTTVFILLDYDLHYSELSLVLLTANYYMDRDTTFSFSTEYRQSPFLTTSNALIGQGVTDLDELLEQYDEEEIRQLASDRSADYSSAHLGFYHVLNESLQVGFDVAWSKLGESQTSAGVEGFEGTDDEWFYLLQLTGVGLLLDDDIWTAKLRYSDTTNYDVYGTQLYSRFRLGGRLLLVPEVNVEYKEYETQDLDRIEFGPELKIEYELTESITVELEGGYLWSFGDGDTADDELEEYYFYLGYYWRF